LKITLWLCNQPECCITTSGAIATQVHCCDQEAWHQADAPRLGQNILSRTWMIPTPYHLKIFNLHQWISSARWGGGVHFVFFSDEYPTSSMLIIIYPYSLELHNWTKKMTREFVIQNNNEPSDLVMGNL
jgi:hypothetical protein